MTERSNKEKQNANAIRKAVSTNTRIYNITSIIVLLLMIMGYVANHFGNDNIFDAMFISIGAVVFFALMLAAIMKVKEEKKQAACKKNETDSNADTDH